MNIHNNLIIHSAIKWGTFWHERRSASVKHLTVILPKIISRKKHAFSNAAAQIHPSVGMTPALLLDTHIMRTNVNLFGFKGAGPDPSLCALNAVRHFQVLDLNAGCILIHHQAGEKEKKQKKTEEMKSKHRKKSASLRFQHLYLLRVRQSKGRIQKLHHDVTEKRSK